MLNIAPQHENGRPQYEHEIQADVAKCLLIQQLIALWLPRIKTNPTKNGHGRPTAIILIG